MTRYLIAGSLLFDDELYEISEPNLTTRPVLLGAAASRCFSTLLIAQGAIVTKRELLYEGWERYGQQVSQNSVNQSITQIRRCLTSLGHPDVVVTVPRIGYKISDASTIEKLKEGPFDPDVSRADTSHSVPPFVKETVTVNRVKKNPWYGCILGLGLVAINGFIAWGWGGRSIQSPMPMAIDVRYVSVAKVNNIHFFSAQGLSSQPALVDAHIRKLTHEPPAFNRLANYPYVYLNNALRDNTYSYLLCREPVEQERAGCISYMIIDEVEQ